MRAVGLNGLTFVLELEPDYLSALLLQDWLAGIILILTEIANHASQERLVIKLWSAIVFRLSG